MKGKQDTIIALSTPQETGAIAVICLSGERSFEICQQVFKGKNLLGVESHSLHFGKIKNDLGEILDEVPEGVFKNLHFILSFIS